MLKTASSIKEILETDQYIIPIYQRNFSWGKDEITQLLDDIFEAYKNPKSNHYHLGSLVCFKRPGRVFELIDGQQRYTTLVLINLVLKNTDSNNASLRKSNLRFDARKTTQTFLDDVYTNYGSRNSNSYLGVENFKNAIEIIDVELANRKKEFGYKRFNELINFFYEKVLLFRIEVPEHTDVNHYFEIMNNRGEQLEKHEILKASLMAKLDDKNKESLFAEIWDVCSDMGNYAYPLLTQNLDREQRSALFLDSELIVNDINDFSVLSREVPLDLSNEHKRWSFRTKKLYENTENGGDWSDSSDYMTSLETNYTLNSNFKQEDSTTNDKFKSVIDFPNFLLQVLKLMKKDENTSLNDKLLLEQFKFVSLDEEKIKKFSEDFICALLKYRLLFDKYVIKQDISISDEDRQNWGIRSVDHEKRIENSISNSSLNNKMRMLQTMLHYSHTSNINKSWLHYFLALINTNDESKLQGLFVYARSQFIGNISTDNSSYLFRGPDFEYPSIPLYKFYFLEYLLWEFYYDFVRGGTDSRKKPEAHSIFAELHTVINKDRDAFSNFRFRQLNSKEHLLPRSKAHDSDGNINVFLHSFANLCLISRSENSSANDDHPSYKFTKFNNNISLKRKLMFSLYTDSNGWGVAEIRRHQNQLDIFINQYLKLNRYEEVV